MIERIKGLNPHVPISDCRSDMFVSYGRLIRGFDFSPYIDYVVKNAVLGEGVTYERSISGMEQLPLTRRVQSELFGEMPIEVGWCLGHNSRLDALEYHKSSEVIVAASDLLLLLGHLFDVRYDSYDTSKVVGFFAPARVAVELYATTLHFAPIHTGPKGFKAVIILPSMTNAPLDATLGHVAPDKLLSGKNKWLMAHPDSPHANRGAYVGLSGENIEIKVPSD